MDMVIGAVGPLIFMSQGNDLTSEAISFGIKVP